MNDNFVFNLNEEGRVPIEPVGRDVIKQGVQEQGGQPL